MIATWMLYGTVVALLAGVAALALDRGMRLLGRAGRWCWAGAMAVTLALPVVAWYQPQVLPPVPLTLPALTGTLTAAPPVTISAPSIHYSTVHPLTWADLNRPLAVGWGVLSLALLGWFGAGAWRLARMRRSWAFRQVGDGEVLVSQDVGPAVVGFFRCRVVVPAWSLDLDENQRELLLAHEAEHLAAHDARLLMVSAALVALVPWNLGLWWQFRHLRLAIELDCDARVLRRRPDRALYGRLLLDVGARAARSFVPLAAFHEPISSLEKRIRSMTSIRPKRAGLLAAFLAVGAGIATIVACEAPRPTAPAANKNAGFTFQTREEEGGGALSKYIGDSVRRYFPDIAAHWSNQPVYLWFIMSPEHRVLRYGTTPRVAGDDTIRSTWASHVVPGFDMPTFSRVTMVGVNAMGAGSPPVYWAELRDPSKPLTHVEPDTDWAASVPWVGEAMRRYYGDLLGATQGSPTKVWFLADPEHHVLSSTIQSGVVPGQARLGPDGVDLGEMFPGLSGGTVRSITAGATRGWAAKNVTVVWVEVPVTAAVTRWLSATVPPLSAIKGRAVSLHPELIGAPVVTSTLIILALGKNGAVIRDTVVSPDPEPAPIDSLFQRYYPDLKVTQPITSGYMLLRGGKLGPGPMVVLAWATVGDR